MATLHCHEGARHRRCGYIGSSTVRALEAAGHTAVILDTLVTGKRQFVGHRAFYQADFADVVALERVLLEHPDLDGVIHMVAMGVVPESVANPSLYYRGNGTAPASLARP